MYIQIQTPQPTPGVTMAPRCSKSDPRRSKKRPKTFQDASKTPPRRLFVFHDCLMSFWIDCWSMFNPNLVLAWPQKSTKVLKNPIPRSKQKLIDFCFDFGSFWGPSWGPSWDQVGHQHHQQTSKNASKTPLLRAATNFIAFTARARVVGNR